jgi:hypothetical protein
VADDNMYTLHVKRIAFKNFYRYVFFLEFIDNKKIRGW